MKYILTLLIALLPFTTHAVETGDIDGYIDGMYQVVYDSGELSGATTTIDIENLEGDTDKEYKLIIRTVNGYSGASQTLVRLNDDSSANYGVQYLRGRISSATAARATAGTSMCIANASATSLGAIIFGEFDIYAVSGNERTLIQTGTGDISGTTVSDINLQGHSWNNTADELVSINIFSAQTNGLGVGSRVILLKKVDASAGTQTGDLTVNGSVTGAWEKIYENDVSSATQTVTMSGLTGNTDVIYRVITYAINDDASTAGYDLTFNDDGGSNYGRQTLYATNTTVTASRGARSSIDLSVSAIDQGEANFTDSLMYVKSGYERVGFSKIVNEINGTTVDTIALYGFSYNDTSTEVTSIEFFSEETSGIGVDSHIELWRLNL